VEGLPLILDSHLNTTASLYLGAKII